MTLNPIKYIRESDGFLTKTGKLINYYEWHSFGLGVLSAKRGWDDPDEAFEMHKENMSHPLEWQYFYKGYCILADEKPEGE